MDRKNLRKKRILKRASKMVIVGAVIIGIGWGIINAGTYAMGKMLSSDGTVNTTTSDILDKMDESHEKGFEIDAVEWDEDKIQATIHQMSHQKVQANEKWTSIKMTDNRINSLQMVIEQKKDSLYHYDVYKEILDRWEKGDFSKADEDHNAVWSLQGGTIGKADGLLSAEEEQDFIDQMFRSDDAE